MSDKSLDDIESEDDLQSFLELNMESNDWTVLREVTARHSNNRADIIAQRDDIGDIGIECKYVTGGPVVVGEAARQICRKYADEKFFQWDIDAWGVCLFGRSYVPERMMPDGRSDKRRIEIYTTQRVLNGLGLGFVTLHQDRVLMEFLPTGDNHRIPLFSTDEPLPERYAENVDMNRIEELVRKRRP